MSDTVGEEPIGGPVIPPVKKEGFWHKFGRILLGIGKVAEPGLIAVGDVALQDEVNKELGASSAPNSSAPNQKPAKK